MADSAGNYAAANTLGRVLKQTVIPDTREALEQDGPESTRFNRGMDTCFEILDEIIEVLPVEGKLL